MSVSDDVLDAVLALLTPALAPVPVKRRKRPNVTEDDLLEHGVVSQEELFPLVTVSPAGDRVEDEAFGGVVVMSYGVLVVVIDREGANYEAVGPTGDLLQLVRQTLHRTTLSGAPTVYDCDVDNKPPFDRGAMAKGFDYSPTRFDYLSREARNG